jgi:hypothetical protein
MAEARAFTDTRQFRIMRLVIGATNPLTKRLLDSRFAGPMAKALLLLRYRGRKSGRTFTTPVGYVREGDRVVMVTSPTYRWWPNLVDGAHVELRLPEGWRSGRGEVVMPDDPRYDETLAFQVSRRGPGLVRGFGLDVDDQGRLDPESRATAATKAHLVLVMLDPAAQP